MGSLAVALLLAITALEWRLPFELWHIHRLDSDDPAERDAALEVLVQLGSTRGAAAWFERWIARAASIEPSFPVFEAREQPEGWRWLIRFGPAAVPALEAALGAKQASVRGWAAALLAHIEIRSVRAGRALLAAYGDVDPHVRELAALAFGRAAWSENRLIAECVSLAVDERQEETARNCALEGLASAAQEYRDSLEEAEKVVAGLRPRDEWDAIHSVPAETLVELRDINLELLVKSLVRVATSPQPPLRAWGLRHLFLATVRRDEQDEPWAPESVKALIHRGLGDADKEVCLAALSVVGAARPLPPGELARAWQLVPQAEASEQSMARAALLEIAGPLPAEGWADLPACLRDPHLDFAVYQQRFRSGGDMAMEILLGALREDSTTARENALLVLAGLAESGDRAAGVWPPLMRALVSPDSGRGEAAVAAASRVARSGGGDAADLLELLRADRAEMRRRAAIVLGVGRWQPGVVGPPLRAALDDADAAVQAAALASWAAAGGAETAAIVLEASRRLSSSPHAAVRRVALKVLDQSGRDSPEAVAALRRAARDDPDPDVRAAAAELRAE